MRAVVATFAVIFVGGCARGIVHSSDAVESAEVTVPAAPTEAGVPDVDAAETGTEPTQPTSCEATKNDGACFDCCDAMYPKAIDIWDDALEACCPNEECSDDAYEKCELAADDLCAKSPECAGLEACEEKNGCWEKPSSDR